MGNVEHARTITEELKRLGVRIAIDDFGTGYSSLRHLHALPFDEIKVDRSFVQSMLSRRDSRKIVAAIIGLGQSLGLMTVAEGVEDEAQAAMLQWLGCEIGQGYLYGRPVSEAKLERYVLDQVKAARRDAGRRLNGEEETLRMDAPPSQRLAQLQAIYDGAPVGLCFVDRNERYVSMNKRMAELNNAPIVAHLGRTVAEMIPTFYEFLQPYLKRALAGEAFSGLVSAGKRSDGAMQVRSTSYQPTLDEAGEVVGVSIAVLDLTDHENTEVALRESEDHHRYAMELSPQVPWTADRHGLVLEASPRWTALTGMTEAAAMGSGWYKAVHPEDLNRTETLWGESVRTGHPVDLEFRIKLVAGGWRWVRARAAARVDKNGGIVRWYGTLEDIDDYKKAKSELQESVARLEAVFQAVPVGIVIAEAPSGKVVMRNPQAASILGTPSRETEDMEGHATRVMFHKDGRRVAMQNFPMVRALMYGETTSSEDFLFEREDGNRIWISVTAAPIHGTDGGIVGGVVTVQATAPRFEPKEHQIS